ncbi:DNA damage-inducible protein F [Sporomusaceae bacterium FL31]|nr:DNA damage-inducible protein F [Sporomusaceae bacterium FL31]GCE34991.1 DNA damage-inducible protein F [Sporomusaceae bacterium]
MKTGALLTMANHKRFLALAVPLTITTLTTPLLGVVDTAIMGRLPQAAYIGGVSLGVLIFNTVYWLLGFLRVSTSGFSAQANGLRDRQANTITLLRPLMLATLLGLILVALQQPVKTAAFRLMSPNETLTAIAANYYDIRIWGAPFALINYVIAGWLMGMEKIRLSLWLQVALNVLNMILAVIFVVVFGMTTDGVALATLIAEVGSAIIGLTLIACTGMANLEDISLAVLFDVKALAAMMKVNGDLLVRTACLLAVFNSFAAYGLRYGEIILAANAVLLQLHYVLAYFLSGFANAGTVLVGKALGEKNKSLYISTIGLTALWGGCTALVLAAFTWLGREWLIGFFTINVEVQRVALAHIAWVAMFPVVAFWGLQLYGVFTGAIVSVPIRNSMLYSLVCYSLLLCLAVPVLDNHGIWLAFIGFSLSRSLFLWAYLPKLHRWVRESFV